MVIKKLKTLASLKRVITQLEKKGKRIVFTNGCFDLLHPGHIKLLEEAREKGDVLVVGLNSDKSVKKIKGRARPILNQDARVCILSALECVDYIIIFDEATPQKAVSELKPHYLVKGGDWKANQIVGREIVKKVFRIKPLGGYSTSGIIKKIIRDNR